MAVSAVGSPLRATRAAPTVPRNRRGTSRSVLAADAVAVAVELAAVTRLTGVDRRGTGGPDGVAVRVVGGRRLRHGLRGRRGSRNGRRRRGGCRGDDDRRGLGRR